LLRRIPVGLCITISASWPPPTRAIAISTSSGFNKQSNRPRPVTARKLRPGDLKFSRRVRSHPGPILRDQHAAAEALKRTVNADALRQIERIEVNSVDLIFHHVNALTTWTLEECKILVAKVPAAAPQNLFVIKCVF